MLFNFPNVQSLLSILVAFLLALSGHEFAHGLAADLLGDPTARRAGRLTLNPLAHVDIVGLLALLVAGFGWAKPVPINPFLLKGNRRAALIAVSVAGPLANLLMAFLGAVIGVVLYDRGLGNYGAATLAAQFVAVNVMLAVFNLIPIPPLDGSQILAALLPGPQEWLLSLQRYGVVILFVLAITGLFRFIIGPPISVITNGLYNLSYLIATIFH